MPRIRHRFTCADRQGRANGLRATVQRIDANNPPGNTDTGIASNAALALLCDISRAVLRGGRHRGAAASGADNCLLPSWNLDRRGTDLANGPAK